MLTDVAVLGLLSHLESNPVLVAITPDEVAALRVAGWVESHGLKLTELGRQRVHELRQTT